MYGQPLVQSTCPLSYGAVSAFVKSATLRCRYTERFTRMSVGLHKHEQFSYTSVDFLYNRDEECVML